MTQHPDLIEDLTNDEVEAERPIAYSYVRFSTARQELGDSVRRQVALAEAYAERNNLELSDESFRDLGVSAFKKKNIQNGALAAFIKAVDTGRIKPGSYLLIEHFDRLSRAEVTTALRLLLHLVDAEITVITLTDDRVWNKETVEDTVNLLITIILMGRAHEESKMKSTRLYGAWGQKKQAARTGTISTRMCPKWLVVNEDKTEFNVFEDRVESIKKVFDLRIAGYGVVGIARKANMESWPIPGLGDMWHNSLVQRLLRNRALIGEYQPNKKGSNEKGRSVPEGAVIENYFPVVIDEQLFLRAQAVNDRRGKFPGRRDANMKNWLQGLLRCNCGKSMVRKNKGEDYARYYCSGRSLGKTNCPGVNVGQLEGAILTLMSGVAPQYFKDSVRSDELKAALDILELEATSAEASRDRFVNAIAESRTPIPVLVQRLDAAETEFRKKLQQAAEVRAELADISDDYDSVFENITNAIQGADSVDERAALREELSRVIAKAIVHEVDGYVEVHLRGQEVPVLQPMRTDALIPGLTIPFGIGQEDTEEEGKQWVEL